VLILSKSTISTPHTPPHLQRHTSSPDCYCQRPDAPQQQLLGGCHDVGCAPLQPLLHEAIKWEGLQGQQSPACFSMQDLCRSFYSSMACSAVPVHPCMTLEKDSRAAYTSPYCIPVQNVIEGVLSSIWRHCRLKTKLQLLKHRGMSTRNNCEGAGCWRTMNRSTGTHAA
jgi:hypothetical protein